MLRFPLAWFRRTFRGPESASAPLPIVHALSAVECAAGAILSDPMQPCSSTFSVVHSLSFHLVSFQLLFAVPQQKTAGRCRPAVQSSVIKVRHQRIEEAFQLFAAHRMLQLANCFRFNLTYAFA